MWLYQSHRVFFKKFIFRTKNPKLQQLLSCAGKPWIQDTPWTKVHTRNMMQGLCSGYYQGSLRALRTQWQAPCVGLWQHSCWDVDTQLSCNVLLSSLGGKDCPCQDTLRLVAPHRQPSARALMDFCPSQCLDGVNSRPNDHRDEQSTGAPVRWILNTMGPLDQQWHDRPFLQPCMMLRDTVIPSLTSHFRFHH